MSQINRIASKKQQVIDLAKVMPVLRPADLQHRGLPTKYLQRLEEEGLLHRIDRGLYQPVDAAVSQHQSLLETAGQVPNGVVALLSALAFHEFTTQNPSVIWLAIDRTARRPKVSYPPVHFVTMSAECMSVGVEEHIIQGITIKVFSPAKTVADCFKYRNKIGLDVALEALKEGWRGKKFKIPELLHYAEVCRVKNIIMRYMEAVI